MMIGTEKPELHLRGLGQADAENLHRLIQENHAHLTAHGDYAKLAATSLDDLRAELAVPNSLRFGLFVNDSLVGCMDLIAVDPPRYGLGYWLARNATGRGYATTALNALLSYAAQSLGATEVFAGVTHGNAASEAVLRRAGFAEVARFDTYTRFGRALAKAATPPPFVA